MTELLSLSTVAKEPAKFLIDGEEFKMFTFDHISKEAESATVALFAKLERQQDVLAIEEKVEVAEKVATRIRTTRLKILGHLTNVPAERLDELPLSAQVTLLEAVSIAITESTEPEETGNDEGDDD
jgi:hypothetical protein